MKYIKEGKMVKVPMCDKEACEDILKADTGKTKCRLPEKVK